MQFTALRDKGRVPEYLTHAKVMGYKQTRAEQQHTLATFVPLQQANYVTPYTSTFAGP